ncbi:MAG: ABC transporter ATP-binding protein [candidate division WOR-3 bacterium]|nr:ABC transporter ATP-binding protein [candidate division WOR-3 bacterium]MDW7987950.1 ABC transporter ATP-binding protein [candidate division WOR-3 bacterium]
MPKAIYTENLTKVYRSGFRLQKVKAVENLNLEVEAQEIYGFLGPNGAGKTTTIKILVGLAQPTSGKAVVLGRPAGDLGTKKLIGFLPESPYFYEYLNAVEYLTFCAQLSGIEQNRIKKQVEKMLALVRLDKFAHMPIRGYSRGMLQRLGIAQALIGDPELVILDEPMGGLDPIGRREFRDIILALKAQGKTVFFSTHILADVELICSRVGIILNGRLINSGRLDEILLSEIEGFELIVKGLDRKMVKVIERFASKVISSAENETYLEVTDEAGVERVLAIVREVGGKLISLQPKKKTLEDHFIDQIAKERLKAI